MNTPGQNPVANGFLKMLKRPRWIINAHAFAHLNYMWSEIYHLPCICGLQERKILGLVMYFSKVGKNNQLGENID